MRYHPVMVVGAASHVGKSVLTTGLCRLLARRGLSVAPFKGQNMALNAGVTPDGGEIGRAQIAQAEAAGVAPERDMNPVLLKPNSDRGSQVIVDGAPVGNYRAVEYYRLKPKLAQHVRAAFDRLAARFDVVVMEGAGSCAEVNLRRHDLTNLSLGADVGARSLLVADIDAGGVFAQVLGTLSLLRPRERRTVAGVAVNKFRGDPALFADGVDFLAKRGRVPVLGVVPWLEADLPQEDGVSLERGPAERGAGALRVGAVRLARVSNFTDLDPLAADGAVVRWITRPEELAGLDLVILPGTKNTRAALAKLASSGLAEGVRAFHALGGRVLGLCGGYQALGLRVDDPDGVEGAPGASPGLGLLPLRTCMAPAKKTRRTTARALPGTPFAGTGEVHGYEIHMGVTRPDEAAASGRPLFQLAEDGAPEDGWLSADGRVAGTYLHGILENDAFRAALRRWVGAPRAATLDYAAHKDRQYDRLADHLEAHLTVEPLLRPRDG